MARTGRPAARRVAAVERALALLQALAADEPELGTNELARRTGLNASTVSRLLATLTADGLVEHVPESGRYRLGLRLLELGNAVLARVDLRDVARPHLRGLAAETGETATLSAPAEPDAITVDFVQSGSSVQSVARLGRPSVGHATAAGKVVLAFGGGRLPPPPLKRFTARTIVDPDALAAPVFGPRGELAAILGVQGPAGRLRGKTLEAALPPLLTRARAISEALGWRPTAEEAR